MQPNWMKRWTPRATPQIEPITEVEAAQPRKRRMSGEYQALYTYLENRYAQTVVLTFEQIEALLGFALPERARSDREWWTSAATTTPQYQDAWLLASRTAVPNLPALNVVFERVS